MRGEAIARFRVYPEAPSGLYFTVLVFPSWAAFDRHRKQVWFLSNGRPKDGRRTLGGVVPFVRGKTGQDGRERVSQEFAEIHLCVKRITMEIITHEAAHATHAWARRQKLEANDMAREERWCYAHGRICQALENRLIKAKLAV